jgi:gamma-glutamyltranspeptidase/glutathione hydrolase
MADPLHLPYPSRRVPVYARRGMVATSQPLAAEAGVRMLREGGNAIDAAVATAAALTVLEPVSNGIGSDAFAIVWTGGALYGLNSSGHAPKLLTRDVLTGKGERSMPARGLAPITVPGAPAAWAALVGRFGRLPLSSVLAPAIEYASEGFPLSPHVGRAWQGAYEVYRRVLSGSEFRGWFETFAPNGKAPGPGDMWRSPGHAETLASIAETGARSFYEGALADRIDRFFREEGGYLRAEDLAAFTPEWVEPVRVGYRGYEVAELPPNGQGLVALVALRIAEGFTFDARDSVETYHRQIEALKLAFADGLRYIADPRMVPVPVSELLSDQYISERRALIGPHALDPAPGRPPAGGTVYLCAADGEGNMVSYIQSNYAGFGSGVVVPGTGISLQNRGALFSLDPDHPNSLEPGKRPYHTIIPGFLLKAGEPVGPFGIMGGFMQPQAHLQVISNLVDFDLNPQAALDAPRWQWLEGRQVELEYGTGEHIAQALRRRGHDIRWALGSGGFGRGQIIFRHGAEGVLVGATEPRADGHVAAF